MTNIEQVQELYDAFGNGEVTFILKNLTKDVSWSSYFPSHVPISGDRNGIDQVADFFRFLGNDMEFHEFKPEEFFANSDKVIATGTEKALVKATGKTYTGKWVHIFTFQEGKIAQFSEFIDPRGMGDAFQK